MESAIQAFLITVAIVGGILSPLILLNILSLWGKSMTALAHKLEAKTEEIKQKPPFDDVELNLNERTKVLSGRIIKDEQVLWQGSVTRKDI